MPSLTTIALELHPLNLLGGGYDWIILLVVAVLLFGGTRLAGIGKGAGRAIREFKEETDQLHKPGQISTGATAVQPQGQTYVAGQPVQAQVQQVPVQEVPSMDQQAAADLPPQQRQL